MENSKIEWTDHTFNPWIGCTKVSDGCKHCYAEALMDKRLGRAEWGVAGKRVRTSNSYWKKPLLWNRKAKTAGVRYRVFCASLADVFEDKSDQPELDEWRFKLFDLIIDTPNLDWLLLTKRPENVCHTIERVTGFSDALMWFPDNVWIGTSVENQEQADKRIPELLKIPAKVRFLSMEPLLGEVDLTSVKSLFGGSWRPLLDHNVLKGFHGYTGLSTAEGKVFHADFSPDDHNYAKIDWVIVGGESGRQARPMHPDWVRSIRDQCEAAGVPFFFKQWGAYAPIHELDCNELGVKGKTWFNFDPDTSVCKVGKARAGRVLDGREWSEFPAGLQASGEIV